MIFDSSTFFLQFVHFYTRFCYFGKQISVTDVGRMTTDLLTTVARSLHLYIRSSGGNSRGSQSLYYYFW